MRTLLILAAALALSSCSLLSGKHHVMSYGVEAGTDSALRAEAYTFSVTVSGR